MGRSTTRSHGTEGIMIDNNRNQLPYWEHRRGTGPTLVLLHYWGGSTGTWAALVECLPGRDIITLDFRGWSRSRDLPGPYTLRQLAVDTLASIADAALSDYVLVGHSMGGKVAQLVAAGRPAGLRGLVLVASGPAKPAANITPEYQQDLAHAYDSDETIAWARDHVLTALPLSDVAKARVLRDSRASSSAARTEWPLHGIAEDVVEYTRKINAPTLVVAGEHDQVEPIEVLRDKLVPYLVGAKLVVVPQTGHLIPLEAPERLADVITEFAATLRPR